MPHMHALTTAPSSPFPHRCVDSVVEPWPEAEIPIHMGSRHQMRVEGKHISGWITMVSKDQKQVGVPPDGMRMAC
jgi:hypothetical protein